MLWVPAASLQGLRNMSQASGSTPGLVWNPSERKMLENKESFGMGKKKRERFLAKLSKEGPKEGRKL